MQKTLKIIGQSMMALGTMTFVGGAMAASGRVGVMPTTMRMPTMPTANVSVTSTATVPTTPTPTPTPVPDPDPDPVECPDGGVKNSAYTVDNCMNDILNCVNGGALPNGMNDLFDPDLRASIFGGMNLCATQVDRCISDVRKNCANVYLSRRDVWIDFDSRKIQPTYYYFVLQRTGLTPNQAENTCLLLDKNTYGSSFTAVSADNNVTQEYNKNVGAYNSQGNDSLIKTNPMGVTVNTNGAVDAQRGHYARWDAKNAQCLVRIAAYNKDKHITNKWLGIGDDTPAEVWQSAGSTFTCNKDLFGFSLLTKTKSAALIAIPGGAIVGAATGAIIGSNMDKKEEKAIKDLNFEKLCKEESLQKQVTTIIKEEPALEASGNAEADCALFFKTYTTELVIDTDEAAQYKIPKVESKIQKDHNIYFYKQGMSNAGKGALIGAGAGAGAGGIATAITAFVERNNITCHVGDNLDKVSYNKSHSIESLRDFYVKWNLNLPESAVAPVVVDSCATWKTACARYTDLNECVSAQFNYKQPTGVIQVFNACVASGSVCVENSTLTTSYGVCP